jgi:hypothetical protein
MQSGGRSLVQLPAAAVFRVRADTAGSPTRRVGLLNHQWLQPSDQKKASVHVQPAPDTEPLGARPGGVVMTDDSAQSETVGIAVG